MTVLNAACRTAPRGTPVTQLRDLFAAPVWHPDDHPPLPPIVAHGRKPAVFACGVCHRADVPVTVVAGWFLATPRAVRASRSGNPSFRRCSHRHLQLQGQFY
jgi:hypothetical protein